MERKKRKVKTARRFMAFLAAVCMIGTMPGMPAISHAEESVGESMETYDAGAERQEDDLGDPAVEKQPDGSGQESPDAGGGGTEDKEDAEENNNDTEEPGDQKDTGEDDSGELESSGDTGENDAEPSEDQENSGENGDGGIDDTDKAESSGDGDKTDGEEIEEKPEDGQDSGNPDEDTEQTEEEQEGSEADSDATISGNTVQTCGEKMDVAAEGILPLQEAAEGKSFQIDGRTYNSADADQTYPAGDDITAYYFEADSLLYFDGTGPMADWQAVTLRPWYRIEPEYCVVGEGITTVGFHAFYWPTHSPKSITLPDTLLEIRDNAFYQCSEIEEAALPEGLEKIGNRAFLGCRALLSIEIPGSVTEIGECAFYECKSAVSVHVPGSVKEISSMAFASCGSARTITIDEGVEVIGEAAFQSSKISELSLPGSVKTIGDFAFGNSKSLHTLTIPDSVAQIGARAFSSCNALFTVNIGTGVTSIGEHAFQTSPERKFRLNSENETAWAYDWASDRRVPGCQVTFNDADGLLSSWFIGLGEKVLDYAPQVEGEATDEEVFTFTGWEPEVTEETTASGDAEYTAVYRSVPRAYHVVFKDFDQTVIADLELDYGTDLYGAQPDTPKRAPDGQYSYTFSGWTPALTEGTKVRREAEYTASYIPEKQQYTITFLDYDGSTLKKVEKPYGTVIAEEAPTPEREDSGGDTYTFAGWQPALNDGDILSADVTYEAVYTSGRKECRVVFKDYDGRVLQEDSVHYGDTLADGIPEASRKDEGLSSYTFAGWQPAFDKTAPILGDITYTALYTRKTQTGIYVEHGLNHPSGSSIGAADIRVYPVYETYDTEGRFQEKTTDTENPVDSADIRLPSAGTQKGENEIHVEQISTGCTSEIHIYGSYIDGIFAVPVDAEVKTGTQIGKADVYFTRNQKGEDGEIQQGVAQKTEKAARYTLNGGTSPVIAAEGDNRIEIVEMETGEEHSCTIHVTGVGKGTPEGPDDGDDGKEPGDDDDGEEPGDGDDEKDPGDGDDEKEPGDGDDDGKNPGDGDDDGKEPGDGDDEKEPGDGDDGKNPGGGDDGKKPGTSGGDGGQKPDNGTDRKPGGSGCGQPDAEPAGTGEEGNAETAVKFPAGIKIALPWPSFQKVQEKKPVIPMPETSDESVQPEEEKVQTEDQERAEEVPGQEEPEAVQELEGPGEKEERRSMAPWIWFLLILGAGAGILGVLSGLLLNRKQIICGTVLDVDGSAMCGIKVTLAGQEEELMETQTDGDGQYLFGGLGKDTYRLCVCQEEGPAILLADISMDARAREKVFTIIKDNADAVETKRSGGKYQINVTA